MTNSADSIRQRLLNLARARGEDFQFVLIQYAIQRLLYRLGISKYKEQFLLKGSWIFAVWSDKFHRMTRDVDLLGFSRNDIDYLVECFQQICALEGNDGLMFNVASFKGEEITENGIYNGVRITGSATLARAIIPLQIDVGFGDAVVPKAQRTEVASFLDLPCAELRVYPVYTVIAEKFQAMVTLGLANSRMKDFYDILTIARMMPLDGAILLEAVTATFRRRETFFSSKLPFVLSTEFGTDDTKHKQWQAFLNKNRLQTKTAFTEVIEKLNSFLGPVYLAGGGSPMFDKQWFPEDWQWARS